MPHTIDISFQHFERLVCHLSIVFVFSSFGLCRALDIDDVDVAAAAAGHSLLLLFVSLLWNPGHPHDPT